MIHIPIRTLHMLIKAHGETLTLVAKGYGVMGRDQSSIRERD